jgi:hypothetical protein
MRSVRAGLGSVGVFCVLCSFAVAACSGGVSRSTASTTNVPTSLAKQHLVSLSVPWADASGKPLTDETRRMTAMRDGAAERCKADPTVTAVVVTSTLVYPGPWPPYRVIRRVEFRCNPLR